MIMLREGRVVKCDHGGGGEGRGMKCDHGGRGEGCEV